MSSAIGKRLAAVPVSGEMMAAFCRTGTYAFRVDGSVPATARFHSAYFDHARQSLVYLFEDESFDPVESGRPIPMLEPPTVTEEKAVRVDADRIKRLANQLRDYDNCHDGIVDDAARMLEQIAGER